MVGASIVINTETRFAAEGVRTYGDVVPSAIDGIRNIVIKQPIGVVGIITPWNCKWSVQ
jgi:acyl-CoA reductase-like NAD-dependent aldehyde dehydrogenase